MTELRTGFSMSTAALAAGSSPLARPLLRGWSHFLGFLAAVAGTAVLADHVASSDALPLALVYGASLTATLGISALYHCVTWSIEARRILKPFDHAAIFVLIAGSFTPFTHAVAASRAHWMLAVAWGAAFLGMARAFLWHSAPKKLVAAQSVITGWLIASFLPTIATRLDRPTIVITFLGGVLYTAGALVFAFRRPNPAPRIFGFHEIFHLFVVAAATAHFIAVWRVLSV
jgi:hemolysin III